MFESNRHNIDDLKILRLANEQVAFLTDEDQLNSHNLATVDALIVQTPHKDAAESMLHSIRSHKSYEIALKPVFIDIINPSFHKIKFLFDGYTLQGELTDVLKTAARINRNLSKIKNTIYDLDYEKFLSLLTLQYIYSRDINLKPDLLRSSSLGYAYPFLNSASKPGDDLVSLKMTNNLANKGYLRFKAVDNVHVCSSCSGGFLAYRECCPKCSSTDLVRNDVIHHFSCAHVAPEDDYKVDGELICPKCDKELRHIGIDYDKPSAMYGCNTCNHTFQTPSIKAKCVDCGTDNELDQLGEVRIYEYELTGKGEHVAKFGMHEKTEPDIAKSISTVSQEIYELFRIQEQERVKEKDIESFEGVISIDVEFFDQLHPDRLSLIQKEIAGIISKYLSKLDLVTTSNINSYKFLLCDTHPERAEQIGEMIHNNITMLLSDNIRDAERDVQIFIKNLGSL